MSVRRETGRFVAIDFETADYQRDSACAVAAVRVEDGRVTGSVETLLRPPRSEFVFTYIHGITWEMVRWAPTFGQVWPQLEELVRGADFLAAHNASFDRAVLEACGAAAGVVLPALRFECTVRLARRVFGIYPTDLDSVCRALNIPLENHHDALCDAMACARIVLAARRKELGAR